MITIIWQGPYRCKEAIRKMRDCGSKKDGWAGTDYGLYQIYGSHILSRSKNTLLYIGQTSDQTFSSRMCQHYNDWIYGEPGLKIYLGRIESDTDNKKDKLWRNWRRDVNMAEAILVYKYTPNYNSALKQDYPKLRPYTAVKLMHLGKRGRLRKHDRAPKDYVYKPESVTIIPYDYHESATR